MSDDVTLVVTAVSYAALYLLFERERRGRERAEAQSDALARANDRRRT